MDKLAEQLSDTNQSNHTFLMSHYPTSTIVFGTSSKGETFETLSQKVSLFVSGHLHRLVKNLGLRMFSQNPNGFLELELGDLKEHGVYRILVVDNDMISFVDKQIDGISNLPMQVDPSMVENTSLNFPDNPILSTNRKPIIIITNPKDNQFIIQKHEPTWRIKQSTFIRMLIYSAGSIESCSLFLDEKLHKNPCIFKGKGKGRDSFSFEASEEEHVPLWVSAWNPADCKSFTLFTPNIQTQKMTIRKSIHFESR